MTRAIVAILLGLGSIVYMIRMVSVEAKRPKSDIERKLWRKWLSASCIASFFSLLIPGVLEIIGVAPSGSLSCAGAVLFCLFVVRSGGSYSQRLSEQRAQAQTK